MLVISEYVVMAAISPSVCVVAKPIDLLARYISAEDDDLAIEMHEPYTYLNVCMPHLILTTTFCCSIVYFVIIPFLPCDDGLSAEYGIAMPMLSLHPCVTFELQCSYSVGYSRSNYTDD